MNKSIIPIILMMTILLSCRNESSPKRSIKENIEQENKIDSNKKIIGQWTGFVSYENCTEDAKKKDIRGVLNGWKTEYDFDKSGIVIIIQHYPTSNTPILIDDLTYKIEGDNLKFFRKGKELKYQDSSPKIEFLTDTTIKITEINKIHCTKIEVLTKK